MLAAVVADGAVRVEERPDPEPGRGEVLVRVRAAGVNNADLLQMRGGYPAPPGSPPDIPGLELAGEVVEVGADATRFLVDDPVMAVVGGGGHAELTVVHERVAMPVPEAFDWPAAGGFPEVFTTAHDALFTQARLSLGESLLVHGAAGGVGTAAVQLGALAGTRVAASTRHLDLAARLEELGAAVVVPHDSFEVAGPFAVILELVGAANMPANLRSLATGGRIVVIGNQGANADATVNLFGLMATRASISASTLRARPLEGKALAARGVEAHVLPLASRLQVPIAASFPLSDVAAAYERFAAGGKFGKIVLTMD